MKEITLFHDGSTQMTVMALGKAINWNPKTTLNVLESEATALLKYEHIKRFQDIGSNITSSELEAENKALKLEIAKLKEAKEPKLDREALKAKAEELGIEFQPNIPTAKLDELIKEHK